MRILSRLVSQAGFSIFTWESFESAAVNLGYGHF